MNLPLFKSQPEKWYTHAKKSLKSSKAQGYFCWFLLVEELVRESVTFKTWLDVLVRFFASLSFILYLVELLEVGMIPDWFFAVAAAILLGLGKGNMLALGLVFGAGGELVVLTTACL